MARAGRKDRGLLSKTNTAGKVVWFVRLYHEGKDRRFGSFKTKTEARAFYEKAKQEQTLGRFFPERYQHGGYELVQDALDRYMAGNTNKSRSEDARYCAWWAARLAGQRLNAITPGVLDEAKRDLFQKGFASQTVLHYLKCLRHVLNLAVRDEKHPLSGWSRNSILMSRGTCDGSPR